MTIVFAVLFVVLFLAVGAVLVVVFELMSRYGRVLLRLDALEARLDEAGIATEALPESLPVGSTVDDFVLPDASGSFVSLSDFRGRRVLLVNWNPDCGFCDLIAPELSDAHPALRQAGTELLLVSYGDAEQNRRFSQEHGLDCPLLLQDEQREAPFFRGLGTPVAYLLDEQGRVAEPLAGGADQVAALARRVADGRKLSTQRPLSESRLERNGLAPGVPAPDFSLPALDGSTVSLSDFRGRRVLLIFSDPQCGPCNALLPDLVRLHGQAEAAGLSLLLVGRGSPEENRSKAEEHSAAFPIVLQHRWRLSREYGIFATPVAFLINEQGLIDCDVASGADEVLALARAAVEAGRESPMPVR